MEMNPRARANPTVLKMDCQSACCWGVGQGPESTEDFQAWVSLEAASQFPSLPPPCPTPQPSEETLALGLTWSSLSCSQVSQG